LTPSVALRASVASLALLLAAPLVSPAHAQRTAAGEFSETTSTVIVEVPVQVIRDGAPVRGLTAADFEIYDGRKKQPIVGFDVFDLSSPQAAAATATAAPQQMVAAAGRRHFLILFDLAFARPDSILQARKAAADVVTAMHPSDLVAVATYSTLKGPELVLGFTSDRNQIAVAVETLGLDFAQDRRPDPLRLVVADARAAAESASRMLASGSGTTQMEARAGNQAVALEEMEKIAAIADEGARVERSAQVTRLTKSMTDLARLMGTVVGRKYVVYLSEGFDSSILQGTTDAARREELSANATEGAIWDVNSDELYGDTGALNDVEKMLAELRRADCVIQAVDIAGLRPAGDLSENSAGGNDSLLNFAKSTGGQLYENFNDLSEAMDEMLEQTSVTYVLSFQPSDLEWDGEFHKLRVELKNQRGARVIARPGYYAPTPYAERAGLDRVVDAASQVMSGREEGTLDVAVLAAPFAMPTAKAYVPVLIEVGGAALLAGKTSGTLPAELYVYAFDEKGTVVDFLTQTMGLDLARVAPALQQTGVKFFGHLELMPGDYSLRVLVRNGATGASALRNVPLHVPAFASSEAALLPALFPEPAGRWLMVREQPRGEYQTAPYPFMQGQQPYIPASRPVLVPGQDTPMALITYHLPADAQLEARVLGADGKAVATVPVTVTQREGGTPARLQASVKPPSLAPGRYALELRTPDGNGGHHVSTTEFVVN
jgi:VWFA-related protein